MDEHMENCIINEPCHLKGNENKKKYLDIFHAKYGINYKFRTWGNRTLLNIFNSSFNDSDSFLIKYAKELGAEDNYVSKKNGLCFLNSKWINGNKLTNLNEFIKTFDLEIDLNMRDDDGKTLLHYICLYGSLEVFIYYVESYCGNVNFNEESNDGMTCLGYAAINYVMGFYDKRIIDYLLKQGVDVNYKNSFGCYQIDLLYCFPWAMYILIVNGAKFCRNSIMMNFISEVSVKRDVREYQNKWWKMLRDIEQESRRLFYDVNNIEKKKIVENIKKDKSNEKGMFDLISDWFFLGSGNVEKSKNE